MNLQKKLGEYLIEKQIINTSQLEEGLKKQKDLGLPLGETLIKLKYVNENLMLESLADYLGVEYFNISENDFQILDKSLARSVPLELCRKYKVLPLFKIEVEDTKVLTLAMADPMNKTAISDVESATDCRVSPVLATMLAIYDGIGKLYEIKMDVKAENFVVETGDTISLVDSILKRAVMLGASDIHIEPHSKEVHVRLRVDGVLEVASVYPSDIHPSVASRIKIMASEASSLMKMEEKRLPQDGSFARIVAGHAVDSRVSTLPTIFGEKIVIRIFDKDKATNIGRIKDIKLSPRMELQYRKCVRQPSGINVVTGPTGSGKTTTLNAVVNEINRVGINIVTVEDPVEYQAMDYVNQSSLATQIGYTYARALRAIMRQDPDVILIGEVRDRETAEIAVQAALTGHRVFTTLHTEDAAGSVARLVDIGVERFLVSSTVVSALNQRLVRKVCPNCMEEYVPTKVEMVDIGIDSPIADEILKNAQSYNMRRGRGCDFCRNTGYSGRQGVYELIEVTPAIKGLIQHKSSSEAILATAREKDNVNMIFEEGLRLFLSGVTTLGELQSLHRGDYNLKSIPDIFKDAQVR